MPGVPRDLAPLYVEVHSPAGGWIARRECAGAIGRGEADFLLHDRLGATTEPGSGRGPMVHFRLAGEPAVGKRALHGGLLGPLLGRLYFGRRRILDQVRAAVRLQRAGVPTAAVLAVGTARVLGPICTGAIVTRELRGAQNLYQLAAGGLTRRRRREVLLQSADLLRRMHDAGFLHGDLNVSNLVLERGPAGETLHVVDLDRGCFLRVISAEGRLGNLARLLRSYEKWIAGSLRLSRREEIYFLRCYGGRDREMVRFLAKRLVRYRSRIGLHRLRWRLTLARGSKDRIARPLQ